MNWLGLFTWALGFATYGVTVARRRTPHNIFTWPHGCFVCVGKSIEPEKSRTEQLQCKLTASGGGSEEFKDKINRKLARMAAEINGNTCQTRPPGRLGKKQKG